MSKYYAIWDKRKSRWWNLSCSDPSVFNFWNEITGVIKIVNKVPIWDCKENADGVSQNYDTFETRLFTPADALLIKCGKNVEL